MRCKKGIWVSKENTRVPCGQCMPCRINKGRLWSARIIMEWLECPQRCYFLTFTYADGYLPSPEITTTIDGKTYKQGTLEKQRFRQWIKNVQRNNVGPFRYYAVGEYGDARGRAHYHMAIFPQHPAQVHALKGLWTKGFVTADELTDKRARYLANYTAKKLTKSTDERLVPEQEPEFRISSRNPPLGAAFVERVIRYYQTPKGKKLLEDTGDVGRSFRVGGAIHPLGQWPLRKIREGLGIPQTHKGRAKANPAYLDHYPTGYAEWEPTEASAIEVQLNAKTKRKIYRTHHPKL